VATPEGCEIMLSWPVLLLPYPTLLAADAVEQLLPCDDEPQSMLERRCLRM
jgi:hypothetical protein